MSIIPFFRVPSFSTRSSAGTWRTTSVVSVLFDPLVEGLFYVVVALGAVRSRTACQAMVGVVAVGAISVVLAGLDGGVDGDSES